MKSPRHAYRSDPWDHNAGMLAHNARQPEPAKFESPIRELATAFDEWVSLPTVAPNIARLNLVRSLGRLIEECFDNDGRVSKPDLLPSMAEDALREVCRAIRCYGGDFTQAAITDDRTLPISACDLVVLMLLDASKTLAPGPASVARDLDQLLRAHGSSVESVMRAAVAQADVDLEPATLPKRGRAIL